MATVIWTGAASNDWTVSDNWQGSSWNGNNVPQSYDAVVFNEGANVVLSQDASVGGITVNGAATLSSDGKSLNNGNYSLSLSQGAVLTLSDITLTTKEIAGDPANATIVLKEADLTLQYGNTLKGTVIFNDVSNSDGSIGGSTLNVVYYNSSNTSSAVIKNFSNYDKIIISGNEPDNVHLVLNSDGVTYSLQGTLWEATQTLFNNISLAAGVTPSDFTYTQNNDGTYTFACFLADSMILTPQGDVPVQDILIGDEVVAMVNGLPEIRKVVWTGVTHVSVSADLPDDEAGYPVRILKGAFSQNVPWKDMLITSEHCLYLEGRFIPVRLLVNGRSIFYDRTITSYDYYHVETEQHSILSADGVLTESYLDTGNRSSFRQSGTVAALPISRALSWENNAAAPLEVSPSFTAPLFHQIETRAVHNGLVNRTPRSETTTDPQLRLMTDDGTLIPLERQTGQFAFFVIPAGVKSVRLLSRSSRPHDAVGAYVDDRRSLGVQVGRIVVSQGKSSHVLTRHHQSDPLDGWFPSESSGARWTTGKAALSLEDIDPTQEGLLAVEILSAGPYIIESTSVPSEKLTA
ncbi:outer membrane protein [Acetobacter aceti NRIC 0242]|uniref:Hedgehog/Intein (Hint) domain-containing protein n=1 Tax=Acetobacter aceti NBRC 14818 TaxID=887700 RepID=A0AB33IF16_ACEAC|nr:Hint domain-containing protein [Acetobacter aceti]TCS29393.1 Hint domain-containing protein [Acetobacter aceti NBRC 14818]BCK76522.1 hypothetical protein EMQ_2128 [Acetobacter aceti NBRC 14818]GAN57247.1 outer membrane protein/adhesin family protein [Acetobacter aceti NBRC 14818]GBO82328.1 outer membrane protein [Acetobacter aceti NRIC 0242]